MIGIGSDWRARAHGLADTIAEAGDLHDPAWRAAVENIPRHVFVPTFYRQRPDGGWDKTDRHSPGWLDAVYRNDPLVTALADSGDGRRVTVSSSTTPGLMIRMLEALDIRDGHHVLEIGTGTGYNAALLAHRLGDQQVYSVDIGHDLIAAARDRLARLGYHPRLAAVDGVDGFPNAAPYDRGIATCSVPHVPWAWAEQVAEGGVVLVDLKRTTHAGNLALLRKHPDRLEGHFLPNWAGFMAIRHRNAARDDPADSGEPPDAVDVSTTTLDPLPWTQLVPWFLAHTRLPANITFGFEGFADDGPEWATFTAADGSTCAVAMHTDRDGRRTVRQAGQHRLWDAVERAHREWEYLGRPGWDRLGLTVRPDGEHTVWLDDPHHHSWSLIPQIP